MDARVNVECGMMEWIMHDHISCFGYVIKTENSNVVTIVHERKQEGTGC